MTPRYEKHMDAVFYAIEHDINVPEKEIKELVRDSPDAWKDHLDACKRIERYREVHNVEKQ